jgi:8-oxo-dGTP pyrophosphatase MutT (NUDIX family)
MQKEDNGMWEFPGGGLDFGETPQECIIREMKEEAGLIPTHISERPSYFVTALNINGKWKSNIFYETKKRDLNFTPSDECVEMRFFTKEEALQENLYPIVREFLEAYNPDNHNGA